MIQSTVVRAWLASEKTASASLPLVTASWGANYGYRDTKDPPIPDEDSEPWYAAKLIFGWYRDSGKRKCYEERIVLFRALSFEEAIEHAEKESQRYCRESSSEDNRIRYEGFLDVYHLFEPTVGHGVEIYSKIRKSPLEPSEYLDRYYDDPEGEENA